MADKKSKNIFKRITQTFKEVVSEVKKVVWPSKEKLKKTSAVVLLVIVFFAVFLTAIGSGGRWILEKVGFYNTVETTTETTTEATTAATTTTAAAETTAASDAN